MSRNDKGQFEKESTPWNYGTKGLTKSNSTSFKKGYKMSQETKDKIKETMKSNPKISGKNSHMYGKKGKLSHHWAGGITPLSRLVRHTLEYKEWRKSVYKRDNYMCQNKNCKFCNNKRSVYLHPHHIKSICNSPDLIFDIENGITYCKDFHLKSGLHINIQRTGGVLF